MAHFYGYKIHALAQLFPEMPADEYEELKQDIEANGQVEPIVLSEDGTTLLDGRTRLRICKELGIEPSKRLVAFRDRDTLPEYVCEHDECQYLETSEEAYIWSINVLRRHLKDDQRAMLASQFADADAIREIAKKKSKANLKQGDQLPDREDSPGRENEANDGHATRHAIAERAQVTEYKAKQAEIIHKHAPDLEPKIISGEVKLKDAIKQIAPVRTPIRTPIIQDHELTGDLRIFVRRRSNRQRLGTLAVELIEALEKNKIELFDAEGNPVTFERDHPNRPGYGDIIIHICKTKRTPEVVPTPKQPKLTPTYDALHADVKKWVDDYAEELKHKPQAEREPEEDDLPKNYGEVGTPMRERIALKHGADGEKARLEDVAEKSQAIKQ